ncbi:hypothetical protein V8J82_09740 [Gymnodinialimonas sp. 2305UL16-5]|uniref:hypothetical protein n=1 Tax=Gymnodinialimonas mytili TaxID=3126503 RepID=UPI0030AA769A
MKQRITPVERLEYGPATPQSPEHNDLVELVLAARRQMWRIAFWGFLGLLAGAAHYATSPREFTAASTLLIEERQIELEQEIAAVIPSSRSETSITNQIQILQSQQLAVQVVGLLDLTENESFGETPSSFLGTQIRAARSFVRSLLPSRSTPSGPTNEVSAEAAEQRAIMETAQRLRNRTSFRRVGRSFVVEISHSSHDPALATEIVNAYAEAYMIDGTQANIEASDRTAGWMREQVEQLRQEALEAAADVAAFRQEHGAFDQQGLRERTARVDALNELLTTFQSRYQQISLEGTFPVQSGRILSEALPPRSPAEPKAWVILGIGMVFGVFIGLALAILREARELGFRNGNDVTRFLNLSFLGYVPRIQRRKLGRLKRTSAPTPTPPRREPTVQFASARTDVERLDDPNDPGLEPQDQATYLQPVEAAPYVAPREYMVSNASPGSAPDRAIRRIFSTLETEIAHRDGRILAFGGLGTDSGANGLAANLANLAARTGKRSLLVDCDFHKAQLSKAFGAANNPGLQGLLQGTASLDTALRRVEMSDMLFLPVGSSATQAPPSLDHLQDLFQMLRPNFDYIFINLPPVDIFPETKSLAHPADHLILCARWGRTPRKVMREYLQNEPELRRRVFGVVLCDTQLRQLPRYGVPMSATGLAPA